MNEFAINWLKGADCAEVTVPASSGLKNKLLRLKQERPDEVTSVIENKDGSMVCHVPVKWVKVGPPRQVSAEQREAARQRFAAMRESKRSGGFSYAEEAEDWMETPDLGVEFVAPEEDV